MPLHIDFFLFLKVILICGMKEYVSWNQYIKNSLNENQKKNEHYVMIMVTNMII
jgi:hypothetical protein